jgi:hypothetical protein
MSCDATDAQPLCFWRSVITGVGQTCHDVRIAAAELVEEQSTERLAIGLANELAALILPRLPPSPETALLTARLRLLADDSAGALSVLEAVADSTSTRRLKVEHQLLTAIALARSDPPRARTALDTALRLAEPVGLRRTVLAEGPVLWNLLEAHPARVTGHHPPLGERFLGHRRTSCGGTALIANRLDHWTAVGNGGSPDGR